MFKQTWDRFGRWIFRTAVWVGLIQPDFDPNKEETAV